MEHCTSVLDHYVSLLELMGQSTNYEALGTVMAGQVITTKNEMDAAWEEALYWRSEADAKYAAYQASIFDT
jgi:hypothetical protein